MMQEGVNVTYEFEPLYHKYRAEYTRAPFEGSMRSTDDKNIELI